MNLVEARRAEVARSVVERWKTVGWTYREWADRAGVAPRTVGTFVRGERVPTAATLVRLAAALDAARANGAEPEQQVVVEVETPDGNRLRFTGTPANAAEAAAAFVRLAKDAGPEEAPD